MKVRHFAILALFVLLIPAFFTPIGPLRLDYGRRIIRRNDPEGGRLHLSILYAF